MISFLLPGVPNLLIDLRLNGGGNICLGYALDRFLFPSITPIVGAHVWDNPMRLAVM